MADINSNLPTCVKNEDAHPQRHIIGWLILRVCISAVLLASATSKLYSGSDLYSGDQSFIRLNPVLFAVLILIEYGLAILLLFNILPTITLPVASLFFSLPTAISAWLVASGAHSCPCFGHLSPPPWIILGLDLFILLCLIRWSPIHNTYSPPILFGIVKLVEVVAVFVGFGIEARYLGSSARLEGLLEGAFPSLVEVQPKSISLQLSPDEARQVEFQISNHSSTTCSVVGGTLGCSPDVCIDNVSLPVDVPPGATRSAIVSVGHVKSPGSFSREFVLYTSSSDRPRIGVRINIEVPKPR